MPPAAGWACDYRPKLSGRWKLMTAIPPFPPSPNRWRGYAVLNPATLARSIKIRNTEKQPGTMVVPISDYKSEAPRRWASLYLLNQIYAVELMNNERE